MPQSVILHIHSATHSCHLWILSPHLHPPQLEFRSKLSPTLNLVPYSSF